MAFVEKRTVGGLGVAVGEDLSKAFVQAKADQGLGIIRLPHRHVGHRLARKPGHCGGEVGAGVAMSPASSQVLPAWATSKAVAAIALA